MVDTHCAVAIPDQMPLDHACLLDCAVMTRVGAVFRIAEIAIGGTVVVIGCGAIGLATMQCAHGRGGADPSLWSRRRPILLFWESYTQTFDHIRQADLPEAAVEAILQGNAQTLLARLLPAWGGGQTGRTMSLGRRTDRSDRDGYPGFIEERELSMEIRKPDKKIIIVCAVNGGMQKSRDGAFVPESPDEIAKEAERCYKAGAAVVHVHARDTDGANTTSPEVYKEIVARIRERCPILVQTTNGVGVRRDPETGLFVWPPDSERIGLFNLEPRQDLFGIAAGTTDFYHPEGNYPGDIPYVNSVPLLRETIRRAYAQNSAIEYEIVEASAIHRLLRLANEGEFDRNRRNIWLLHGAGFGSVPPIARFVAFSINEGQLLFPQALWGTVGSGKDAFWINSLGLSMGGHVVRIGFEDGLYRANGEIAKYNADQVEDMVTIAAGYGREPATPEDARRIFEIV